MSTPNQFDESLAAELLEYIYGCAEDPTAIEARLDSDPTYAAQLEAMRAQAKLLDDAAQGTPPELTLTPPAKQTMGRLIQGLFTATPLRRAASVIFALAMLAPWLWVGAAKREVSELNSRDLRIVASAPSGVISGTSVEVRVEVWDLEGEQAAAHLSWQLLDDNDAQLAEGSLETTGTSELIFEPEFGEDFGSAAKVRLVAKRGDVEREVEVPLAPGRDVPMAHLSSDKPIYRPGETMRMRAVVLDRLSLAPSEGRFHLRIVDTKGAPAQTWTRPGENGVVALDWTLPEDAAGGTWALELRDGEDEFTVERLPLEVRAFQPPQLAKKLTMDAESYGVGESGSAELLVTRVAGGAAAGAHVTSVLWIDGEERWTGSATLDAGGRAVLVFKVPDSVERGEARLVATISDSGIVEAAVETFLVPTGHVNVAFFPEGGTLSAGISQAVYVELTDALGRAVDGSGKLLDQEGRVVCDFASVHQGRGRFEASFEAGQSYRLVLDSPSEISTDLPRVVGGAVVLSASGSAGKIEATVHTPHDGPWTVGIFCRGLLLSQDWFAGKHNRVSFELPEVVAGVLRVTVFDSQLKPVAERLVHCPSQREIRIAIDAENDRLTPGEHQSLTLRTTDENGRPISAVLGVAVRDAAVVSMAREVPTRLADSVWFLADVEDLEDAPEFLGADEDSLRAVDLLLGTRGWRRFGWADPEALVAEHGDAGKRLLMREGHSDVPRILDVGAENRLLLAQAKRKLGRRTAGIAAIEILAVFLLLVLVVIFVLATKLKRALATVAIVALVTCLMGGSAYLQSSQPQIMVGAFADAMPRFAEVEPAADELIILAAMEAPEAQRLMDLGYAGGPGAGADFFVARGQAARPGGAPMRELAEAGAALDQEVPEEELEEDFDDAVLDELAGLGYADEGMAGFGLRMGRGKREWSRVYAHHRTGPRDVRSDFAETLYWNSILVTGNDGTVQVAFDLSDRVTTWEVAIDAHGGSRVGQALASFEAVPPLALEAKLPLEMSTGDRLLIPISIVSSDASLTEISFEAYLEGPLSFVGEAPSSVQLTQGRGRLLLEVIAERPTGADDLATIAFAGSAMGHTDRVVHELLVLPRGFPHRIAKSGVLESQTEFELALPETWEEGSLSVDLSLYASPLSDLLAGLDGILQQPYGCFEQASTANYPNVLAMGFMQAAGINDPVAARKARDLMDQGYAKLVGYECSDDGFEWFGGSPAHESLTAYGLLQFHDMAQVFDVESGMLERTRAWLLSRRDGEGGYERNARALDSFGAAPQPTTDAYVTYALAVTGTPIADFTGELDRLEGRGLASDDPYEVALAAAACHAAGRTDAAGALRTRLAKMQAEDGSLPGAVASITHSGDRDLLVETTALAVLAWLDDPALEVRVRRGVEWLLGRRQNGRFGSTQATIQALRALTAYAKHARRVANP
ncbi:MAG: hypothetical protein ACI9HE_003811, partial [Planctomycetota bacterium]